MCEIRNDRRNFLIFLIMYSKFEKCAWKFKTRYDEVLHKFGSVL